MFSQERESMDPQPSWSSILESILERASYLTVADFDMQDTVLRKIEALLSEGIQSIAGTAAREFVDTHGLCRLHDVFPAEKIGALRDHVMPQIRPDLLTLSCRVGRKLLRLVGEFFVDDYTILRINFPYEVALRAAETAENPGIGRVSSRTREMSRTDRVIDPVYDPKSYHNNEPPPAWAHGPHQDTWVGHSRLGVNLWWAVNDVPEQCSMVFYPDTFGRSFAPDPRSLYLQAGQPLPKPSKMALRRGEMLIFNPEMLHATHLNISNRTRIAISMRLNPVRPTFDRNCFYAREFWHSSRNLEAGRFNEVIRFARAENLDGPANAASAETGQPGVLAVQALRDGMWTPVCSSESIVPRQKLLLQPEGNEVVLLLRTETRIYALQSVCAHLDISMADGHHDERSIWCPAHAVEFSLATGRSACPLLTLRTYDVREEDGMIWLRPGEGTNRALGAHPDDHAVIE
jgi:nitrite reductase/ring-hydroxylating ferredoxin subunit